MRSHFGRGLLAGAICLTTAAAATTLPASGSTATVRFDHPRRRHGIIAIGASTGGPQAIESRVRRTRNSSAA